MLVVDDAAFVRVSLVMDALASKRLRKRPDSALAYLCSSTDVFAVHCIVRKASEQNHEKDVATFRQLIRLFAGRDRTLLSNVDPTTTEVIRCRSSPR